MRICSKILPGMERGLLWLGLLLLATFAFGYVHRFVMSHAAMTGFEASQLESVGEAEEGKKAVNGDRHIDSLDQTQNADFSLWSAQRARFHEASLGNSAEVLAVLRIPRLHMEAPVLEGTGAFTLNRGVGRIAGTSYPGQGGNIGIAGHRDGFFRPLRNISVGDPIELVTTSGTEVYVVDRLRITSPADVSVLRRGTKPSLTLVTCYPFYFVGPAPKRYVVEASLKQALVPE